MMNILFFGTRNNDILTLQTLYIKNYQKTKTTKDLKVLEMFVINFENKGLSTTTCRKYGKSCKS